MEDKTNPGQEDHSRGWARTGLEPETMVYINFVPYDVIVDTGSSFSTMDVKICESLNLNVHPFSHDISHYNGVEGASIIGSTISILGWVEAELGINYMGCILAKFWITDCLHDKAIPLVIGSHHIRKIFAQANLDKIDCWPKPWKSVYEWHLVSRWHEKECSEDLYDSDDYEEEDYSFQPKLLVRKANSPVNSLSGSWSDILAGIELNIEEDLAEVEEEKQSKLKLPSNTQGIPDSDLESEQEACSAPSAMDGPPPIKEEAELQGGDDKSVFNPLAEESKNTAEEVSDPTCNQEDSAKAEPFTVQLSPIPTLSCKITPTGATILSFQWDANK